MWYRSRFDTGRCILHGICDRLVELYDSKMFIFPIPFPVKAKYFVIGYAVLEMVLGITGSDGVAHFAHLGGMLFGFILIIYWRKKNGGGQQIYF